MGTYLKADQKFKSRHQKTFNLEKNKKDFILVNRTPLFKQINEDS